MRKIIFLAITLLSSGLAVAQDPDPRRGVVLDIGRSTENLALGRTEFDIYRVGLRQDFKRTFWSGERFRLSGYWEASFNYWDTDDEDVYAVALSPVFALYFGAGNKLQPYIEAGIGASLISDHSFAGRELSTSFQFEDRLGLGIRGKRFDIHYRYMHYSNGGIEKPNNGFDANILGFTYLF